MQILYPIKYYPFPCFFYFPYFLKEKGEYLHKEYTLIKILIFLIYHLTKKIYTRRTL